MTTTATTASIEQPTDQHHHSTGRGSTRTGRQSTCCSPHISRCNADIGSVQSTGHTTATSIECCEKEKRCTTQHRDATHTHTHTHTYDEHLSARGDAHALDGTQMRTTSPSTSRSRGENEKDRTCTDYQRNEERVAARDGAPVLLCCRRSPGEHEPVSHLQKARGSQHTMRMRVSWDQPTRRSPIDVRGMMGKCQHK
jgi:hypothetical protein